MGTFTLRIDDDMRRQLEAAVARKKSRSNRKWDLSEEIRWRLRDSFVNEREEKRDPALRALCFLIRRLTYHVVMPVGGDWRSDLFFYKAFKIAVQQLLDALDPPGPASPPQGLGSQFSIVSSGYPSEKVAQAGLRLAASFHSPEERAAYSADLLLSELNQIRNWTPQWREQQSRLLETFDPYLARSLEWVSGAALNLLNPKPQPQSADVQRSTGTLRPVFLEESDDEN
jgi:hypothetical protein